ncbi:hypothetical protein [uncultured Dialister sp.]|uniref:hypothetical protein n=1 Tax=uncultured Dialister sp. TaxID=278064 RepID=UPI0026DB5B9E|nr:hypothetical protein [uncultured Dialister sp.]
MLKKAAGSNSTSSKIFKKGHKKEDEKWLTFFHPLFPLQKLLIRPMLMRSRAQAFCFDESATGRADSWAV